MVKKIVIVMCCIMVVFSLVGCGEYVYKEGDFSFTIMASSQTFQQGEHVEVEVVFRNLSGRQLRIIHSTPLIVLFIGEGVKVEREDTDSILFLYHDLRFSDINYGRLRKNQEIRFTQNVGAMLPSGEYELAASALFSIGRDLANPEVRIISNSIVLTINE